MAGAYGAEHPFILGVEASVLDGKLAFPAMRAVGAQSIRLDVNWKLVETRRGDYRIPAWVEKTVNSAMSDHIEPLLILDYGNPIYGGDKPRTADAIAAFGKYAKFVVTHFKGRVRYFELWNEWETHTGGTTPGSPQGYVDLAMHVYPEIKAANPSAIVLGGGFADIRDSGPGNRWIGQLLDLGGLRYLDALSLHPYPQPGDDPSPEAAIYRIDAIHAVAQQRSDGKSAIFFITEMGYPTYGGRQGVSEETAAQFLARFTMLAAVRPYIRGLWWYGLRDQGVNPGDEEQHYGLFTADFAPKPSAQMFAAVAGLLREYVVTGASRNRDRYEIVLSGPTRVHTVEWGEENVTIDNDKRASTRRPLLDLGVVSPLPR